MKNIKSLILIFIITLSLTKLIDIIVGHFLLKEEQKIELNKVRVLDRNILLKEHFPNQNVFVSVPERYFLNKNYENKKYKFRTDNNGFILGPKDNSESEKIDFIFFGGSTTECIFVDEDLRFPYLLSEKLEHKNGERLNILNAGVSGNHSLHSLINFLAKGIEKKPKFAVLMHAANDMGTLLLTHSYWDDHPSKKIIQTEGEPSLKIHFNGIIFELSRIIKNTFIPNFWLYSRDYLFNTIRSEDLNKDDYTNFRENKITYNEIKNLLDQDFSSSLVSFVKLSRSWNIEPILMTQFNNYPDKKLISPGSIISPEQLYNIYKHTNEIVRKIALDNDVLLIDLDKKISDQSFFYDYIHLNSSGSVAVANEIARTLERKFPNLYKFKKD